jgi:hypothetical protein
MAPPMDTREVRVFNEIMEPSLLSAKVTVADLGTKRPCSNILHVSSGYPPLTGQRAESHCKIQPDSGSAPIEMLPPGALKALKGHYDGIVTVVLFAMAVGGLVAGAPPWADILLLAVGLGMFHIRSSSRETHLEQIAQRKVDEAAAKAEAIKAKHREILQHDLPLERRPRMLSNEKSEDDKKGKRQ